MSLPAPVPIECVSAPADMCEERAEISAVEVTLVSARERREPPLAMELASSRLGSNEIFEPGEEETGGTAKG